MKNLVSLASREEIHAYVEALWQTDIFRDSHRQKGFVWRQVEQFAWLPRMFAEETNDGLERAHFSTWWNVIMKRDYTNPFIHDLYYLHEFAHAGTMPYIADMGRIVHDEKMVRNELEASVLSEIMVYFEMPGLRECSFDHEIYADRFLRDDDLMALFSANPMIATETVRAMRRNVMLGTPDHLLDQTERWIRRFAEQNTAYAVTWADRYNEVETQMSDLVRASIGGHRAQGLAAYRGWLEAEAARDPIDNIPFRQEAELFTPFYWALKAKYDAAHA